MYVSIDGKKYKVYLQKDKYYVIKRKAIKKRVNECDVIDEDLPKRKNKCKLNLEALQKEDSRLREIITGLENMLEQKCPNSPCNSPSSFYEPILLILNQK